MKVKFTKEAQSSTRRERARWRAYRDSKSLFDEELAEAKKYLVTGPKLAVYGILAGKPVRRIQLKKTQMHLFFVIEEDERLVRVVVVWGSRRGDPPGFDDE